MTGLHAVGNCIALSTVNVTEGQGCLSVSPESFPSCPYLNYKSVNIGCMYSGAGLAVKNDIRISKYCLE